MKKIFFDLDGVIRNLTAGIGYDPQSWNEPLPDGSNLYQFVNKNPNILLSAPPTEYWPLLCEKEITIFTCQPDLWVQNTLIWISIYLKNATTVIFQKPEDKLKVLNSAFLVEDYPFFKDYSNIILIDRPYNRNVNCCRRVQTTQELENFLNEVKA